MNNWKNVFKSWAGVSVLILLALVAIWSINSLFPILLNKFEAWQSRRAYEKLSEPYYKDTYGGNTPEETYDLFIVALKDGDIELASKYFVIEDQESWNKTLAEYEKSGSLISFIAEIENTKKIWKKTPSSNNEVVSFEYQVLIEESGTAIYEGQEINIPAGNYTNESVFTKYPRGIWKIDSL